MTNLTIDEIQVLILHHHLLSLYEKRLATLNEVGGRAAEAQMHQMIGNQQKSMSRFYKGIGERVQMRNKILKLKENKVTTSPGLLALVVLLLGLLIIAPVMSQDATDEPTVAVVEVAPVEEMPVVIDIEPPPSPAPVVIVDSGFNLTSFLGGIITGALGALGGIFGVIGKQRDNLPALNAIEWLGKSAPPEMVKAVNDMSMRMMHAAEVLMKVTDNLPNEPGPYPDHLRQGTIPGAEMDLNPREGVFDPTKGDITKPLPPVDEQG